MLKGSGNKAAYTFTVPPARAGFSSSREWILSNSMTLKNLWSSTGCRWRWAKPEPRLCCVGQALSQGRVLWTSDCSAEWSPALTGHWEGRPMRRQPWGVRAGVLGLSFYTVHANERFQSVKAGAASDTKEHVCVCMPKCLHAFSFFSNSFHFESWMQMLYLRTFMKLLLCSFL